MLLNVLVAGLCLGAAVARPATSPSRTGLTPAQLDARVAKAADILGERPPAVPYFLHQVDNE